MMRRVIRWLHPNRNAGWRWVLIDIVSLPFSVIFYVFVGITRATGGVLGRVFR